MTMTFCNGMLQCVKTVALSAATQMPLEIAGFEYLTTVEVCQLVNISRQTLWRWRQDSRIPPGPAFSRAALGFQP